MAQVPQHAGVCVYVIGKPLYSLMHPTLHKCVYCRLERFQSCASCPGALAGLGMEADQALPPGKPARRGRPRTAPWKRRWHWQYVAQIVPFGFHTANIHSPRRRLITRPHSPPATLPDRCFSHLLSEVTSIIVAA